MIDFEQIEQEDRLWPWLADGSMGDHTCEIEGCISDYWYYDEIADYPDQDEDEDKDELVEPIAGWETL